jgi:hypothetical protein
VIFVVNGTATVTSGAVSSALAATASAASNRKAGIRHWLPFRWLDTVNIQGSLVGRFDQLHSMPDKTGMAFAH